MKFNTYLYFNGQCEAAFRFYEKHLGGVIDGLLTYAGTPGEGHVPPEMRNHIIHSRLKPGDQILMGSDAPPDRFDKPAGFSLSLDAKDPAEAERLFNTLAENGKIIMPLGPTFWTLRFGMLVDQFGIPWMVNCEQAG